jgi:hypothetical protein
VRVERVDVAARLARWGGRRGAPAEDISPVVIVDDMQVGPYALHTPWEISQNSVGANINRIAIRNEGRALSITVIDDIFFKFTVADDLRFQQGGDDGIAGTYQSSSNRDTAAAGNLVGLSSQLVADVKAGIASSATAVLGVFFPVGDALPHFLHGPWFIGPSQIFVLAPTLAATGVRMYARGRHYDAP